MRRSISVRAQDERHQVGKLGARSGQEETRWRPLGRRRSYRDDVDVIVDWIGHRLVEQIAAVGDYLVALETYRAAVKRWPKDKITLRNRARVIEQSWED